MTTVPGAPQISCLAVLVGQIDELRRRLGLDSSTSSKPPSSHSPYMNKPGDLSLRRRSGRRPDKQPGAQSPALRQSGHLDEMAECGPSVGAVRRQMLEAPPSSRLTEQQRHHQSAQRICVEHAIAEPKQ
jgi:transposase